MEAGPAPRDRRSPNKRFVISPCLSNIFLHHLEREWFEFEVRPRSHGGCYLSDFDDDGRAGRSRTSSRQAVSLGRFWVKRPCTVWTQTPYRQDAIRDFRTTDQWLTIRDEWYLVHIPSASPNLVQAEGRKQWMRKGNGKEPLRPRVEAVTDWLRRNRNKLSLTRAAFGAR